MSMNSRITLTPPPADWTTLSVEASRGWVNVFSRDSGARQIALDSPAILLQQDRSGGRRRAVFAAVSTTGELVAAPDVAGYVESVTDEDWRLFGGAR